MFFSPRQQCTLFLLLILNLMALPALAKESSKDVVEVVKHQVEQLLKENKKLIENYENLQKRIFELRDQITSSQQELKTLEGKSGDKKTQLRQAENKVLIKKGRKVYLEKQLFELKEDIKFKELELRALQP